MGEDLIEPSRLITVKLILRIPVFLFLVFITVRYFVYDYLGLGILFLLISNLAILSWINMYKIKNRKLRVNQHSFETYSLLFHEIIPFTSISRFTLQCESSTSNVIFFDPILFLYGLFSLIFSSSEGYTFAVKYEMVTDTSTYNSTIINIPDEALKNFIISTTEYCSIRPKMKEYTQFDRVGVVYYFDFKEYTEYSISGALN